MSATATTPFAPRIDAAKMALPANEPSWLTAARAQCWGVFEQEGVPTSRQEDWRFTPMQSISTVDYAPAGRPTRRGFDAGKALCPLAFHQIILENGRWSPERSILKGLPKGVTVMGMAEAAADMPEALRASFSSLPGGLPYAALAGALFRDGVFIHVGRGVRMDRPIHIVETAAADAAGRPAMAQIKSLIVLEQGAEAEIVEEALADTGVRFWTNAFTQVILGENSGLSHYRLQRELDGAARTAAIHVEIGRSARYASHVYSLGGVFVREDLRVSLAGEGGECRLNGLSLTRGDEIVDHHSIVEHRAVGGHVRQLYKAVLDERSRYVFDGQIVVRPGAQKTDAQVYNKNLLLSEDASVNTNPEFKIYADDVSCKHGGTVGQLSPEAMFYLRSRGVGSQDARRLLVYAFGSEMLSRVGPESLRTALESALRSRMPESVEAA